MDICDVEDVKAVGSAFIFDFLYHHGSDLVISPIPLSLVNLQKVIYELVGKVRLL